MFSHFVSAHLQKHLVFLHVYLSLCNSVHLWASLGISRHLCASLGRGEAEPTEAKPSPPRRSRAHARRSRAQTARDILVTHLFIGMMSRVVCSPKFTKRLSYGLDPLRTALSSGRASHASVASRLSHVFEPSQFYRASRSYVKLGL